MQKAVTAAKVVAMLAMLCLLGTTYVLRSRILTLVSHLMAGQDIVANEQMDRFVAGEADREEEYDIALARHEVEMERYESELKLFQEDPEAYLERTFEGRPAIPPMIPEKPSPPRTPEVQRELAELNQAFRSARSSYFSLATGLNAFVGFCALSLVGSLLFLILFDAGASKVTYVVLLVLSFAFIIGPALHTALTTMAYQLNAPTYTTPRFYGY
jgi:hypothetical protein